MKFIIIKKENKREMTIYVENVQVLEAFTQIEVTSIYDVKRIVAYCDDNTIVRKKGGAYLVLVPNNELFSFHEVPNFEIGRQKAFELELSSFIGHTPAQEQTIEKNGAFVVQDRNENILLTFRLKLHEQYSQAHRTKVFFASLKIENANFQTKQLFTDFEYVGILTNIAEFILKVASKYSSSEFNKISIFDIPKDFGE